MPSIVGYVVECSLLPRKVTFVHQRKAPEAKWQGWKDLLTRGEATAGLSGLEPAIGTPRV